MKNPEERCCLFIEEVIATLNQSFFPNSQFDCDRRRGSYECCVPVVDIRIYDNSCEDRNRFSPIAIVSILDPDQPFFKIKVRNFELPLESSPKDGKSALIEVKCDSGEVRIKLKEHLLKIHLINPENKWLHIIEESSRNRKIST